MTDTLESTEGSGGAWLIVIVVILILLGVFSAKAKALRESETR
jgi:Sec-independent protein translocase protein TatA